MVSVVSRDKKLKEELYNFQPIPGSIFGSDESILYHALVHRTDSDLSYAVLLKRVTRQQHLDSV